MKKRRPKVGSVCEVEFDGKWIPGKITGYVQDMDTNFKFRVNVKTSDGRSWDGCSPQCVRVDGKELADGPF